MRTLISRLALQAAALCLPAAIPAEPGPGPAAAEPVRRPVFVVPATAHSTIRVVEQPRDGMAPLSAAMQGLVAARDVDGNLTSEPPTVFPRTYRAPRARLGDVRPEAIPGSATGQRFNVSGRFFTFSRALKDRDGNVQVQCLTATAPAPADSHAAQED